MGILSGLVQKVKRIGTSAKEAGIKTAKVIGHGAKVAAREVSAEAKHRIKQNIRKRGVARLIEQRKQGTAPSQASARALQLKKEHGISYEDALIYAKSEKKAKPKSKPQYKKSYGRQIIKERQNGNGNGNGNDTINFLGRVGERAQGMTRNIIDPFHLHKGLDKQPTKKKKHHRNSKKTHKKNYGRKTYGRKTYGKKTYGKKQPRIIFIQR